MTPTSLNHNEICAILELIEFHDDWQEVSENVGADIPALYDKLHNMLSYATRG
jgi:hypothetical protein